MTSFYKASNNMECVEQESIMKFFYMNVLHYDNFYAIMNMEEQYIRIHL